MRPSTPILALVLLATACASLPPRAPRQPLDVQGHRGARGLLPENTLAGFRRALELGVSTLEIDTGVTADGVVVVSHDRRLSASICLGPQGERLPESGGPLIRDLTLAELQRYDCGSLNPSRRRFPEPPRRNLPGTPMPSLAQVFDLASELNPQVLFNVEMKVHPTLDETVPVERFAELLVELIVEHGLVERVTVQCFDWRAIELVRRRLPDLRTAVLLSPRTARGEGGADSPWLNGLSLGDGDGALLKLLDGAREYADVFSPYWRLVMPGAHGYLGTTVEEIQAAGFPVVPWTVNSERRMEKVIDLGVDGLITDYPGRLIGVLQRRGFEVLQPGPASSR